MMDQIIPLIAAITALLWAIHAILKEIRKWRRPDDDADA